MAGDDDRIEQDAVREACNKLQFLRSCPYPNCRCSRRPQAAKAAFRIGRQLGREEGYQDGAETAVMTREER